MASVLITSEIDAHERRDVAVDNIDGAFPNSEMDEDIIMVPHGRLLELMTKTKPRIYWSFVTIENRLTVLYVKLQKEL